MHSFYLSLNVKSVHRWYLLLVSSTRNKWAQETKEKLSSYMTEECILKRKFVLFLCTVYSEIK